MVIGLLHKIAKNSLERPNVILAVVFFLMPFIFSIAASFVFRWPINPVTISARILLSFALWIGGILLLFILIKLVKGAPALKFMGLMAGLSFIQLLNFILSVAILALLLILMPGLFSLFAQQLSDNTFNNSDLSVIMNSIDRQSDTILFAGFGLLLIFLFLIVTLSLYLIYLLIHFAGQGSRKQNWLILVIWLAIIGIVNFFFF